MAKAEEPVFIRCPIEVFCSMKGISKTELGKKLGFTKQKIDYLINHDVGNAVEYEEGSRKFRVIRLEYIVGRGEL